MLSNGDQQRQAAHQDPEDQPHSKAIVGATVAKVAETLEFVIRGRAGHGFRFCFLVSNGARGHRSGGDPRCQ